MCGMKLSGTEPLWDKFRAECPMLSRMPILNRALFELFRDGYLSHKSWEECFCFFDRFNETTLPECPACEQPIAHVSLWQLNPTDPPKWRVKDVVHLSEQHYHLRCAGGSRS